MSDGAIARLTENEKECLRRRLLPQTAKEMAIDLGISPHAVEKRLKMARAKLGLSSSLAAARMLAAAEGYQTLVPRSPDLTGGAGRAERASVAAPPIGANARHHRKGSTMLAALFLIALAQDVPAPPVDEPVMTDEKGRDVASRKVGLAEAAAFNREDFGQKDRDASGYLDPGEASAMEPRTADRDPSLPPAPPAGSPDPAAAAKWMAKLDTDRDGRVSAEEYVGYMLPWTLWSGVPAEWHPARPSGSTRYR